MPATVHKEFFTAKDFCSACWAVERQYAPHAHFEYFIRFMGGDHVVFLKSSREDLIRALRENNGQVKVREMSEGRYLLVANTFEA